MVRKETQEKGSFGKRNPETWSSISRWILPPGTLTTGRPQAIYSGIFRVEKVTSW
jgi:hypothetical protein